MSYFSGTRGVDAGCASSIEAIESGEAHAPELAHVATHVGCREIVESKGDVANLGRRPKNMLSISFNNCAGSVFERAYSLST